MACGAFLRGGWVGLQRFRIENASFVLLYEEDEEEEEDDDT